MGRDVGVEGESMEGMWVWRISGEESVETGEGCRCGV